MKELAIERDNVAVLQARRLTSLAYFGQLSRMENDGHTLETDQRG